MGKIILSLLIILLTVSFLCKVELLKESIVVGFFFSIPFGIGLWCGKQSEKSGTLIPRGSLTERFGYILSAIFCGGSLIILFFFKSKLGLFVIISYISVYIFSIFVTILIERAFYCNKSMINSLEVHAKHCVKEYNEEAPLYWEKLVPRWWLNMMSKKWEKEYINVVGKVIFTLNPADPLFSLKEFKRKMKQNNS